MPFAYKLTINFDINPFEDQPHELFYAYQDLLYDFYMQGKLDIDVVQTGPTQTQRLVQNETAANEWVAGLANINQIYGAPPPVIVSHFVEPV